MGEVVFWTIVRIVVLLPILWVSESYISYKFWWIISVLAIYGIIIHPAIIHYRLFEEKNKEVIESTLCSTCQHFDKSAVLCMKYDQHPSKDYLPCSGVDWSPKKSDTDSSNVHKK